MGIGQAIYGSCALAFLGLIALALLRGRISGPGFGILSACALTAGWAADLALFDAAAAGPVLDVLRLSAWLIVMVILVGVQQRESRNLYPALLVAVGFCALVIGSQLALAIVGSAKLDGWHRLHNVLRAGLGVAGLLAAENLLRNADEKRRRALSPLCLALGATFAFELFLYAERLMVPGAGSSLADGRGLVGIFTAPLLAMAMARNRDWRIDIHVSRTFVLHTAVLIASGVFFLSLSGIGILVRELGGGWGPPLQLLTLLGSAVVLTSAFGSRQLRLFLKQLIARHFFSNRFDYRMEWLRFVETVSHAGSTADTLAVRVVRALAQIVDSPAGALWRLRPGSGYHPEAAWNLPTGHGRRVPIEHSFIRGFRGGRWIQRRSVAETDSDWPFEAAHAWLAIPLVHGDRIIGFVVLAPPPLVYELNAESFDLLRAAGKQAASYLAEEESTRALLDSRSLNDFSRRFAFAVHDIKNLASQLNLVVSNARQHIENPAFRSDMMQTLESAVARMRRLLTELHATDCAAPPSPVIEPDIVIADLARELSTSGAHIMTRLGAGVCTSAVDADQLRSILSHLIENAREAMQSGAPIVVTSRYSDDRITIDVVDSGPGMDADFIRDKLFRPFRSTKSGGLGIGAYQTRELLRLSGGELDVISKKGGGTTMRMTLPVHRQVQLAHSAA